MIKQLSDKELVLQVKSKVKEEKLIVSEVLEYLEEVNSRRLYADYTSSLHKFCVKELGYTDAEAFLKVPAVFASS